MKHTEWLNFILIYMTKNNDKIFQAIKNVNQKVTKPFILYQQVPAVKLFLG